MFLHRLVGSYRCHIRRFYDDALHSIGYTLSKVTFSQVKPSEQEWPPISSIHHVTYSLDKLCHTYYIFIKGSDTSYLLSLECVRPNLIWVRALRRLLLLRQAKIVLLFPFDFGLSYTTFSYSPLRLSAQQIGLDDMLQVSVDITNTWQRAGKEVVQLYVRDEQARLHRPEKELKAFAKVQLEPGERQTVTLSVARDA